MDRIQSDADISDPDNELDSDYELNQPSEDEPSTSSDEDDLPLAQFTRGGSNSSTGDGNEADDNEIPLAQVVQSNSSQAKPSQHTFRWRKKTPMKPSDIQWQGSFSDPPIETLEPIQYCHMFFQHELFSHILEQTNTYAAQSGSNFRTDVTEVEQYVGILVKIGLVNMPRYKMYWSKEFAFLLSLI